MRSGNTTLITGVKEDEVEDVITMIKNNSKSRKMRIFQAMPNGMVPANPVEVTVGGAIIFVVEIERFEKV